MEMERTWVKKFTQAADQDDILGMSLALKSLGDINKHYEVGPYKLGDFYFSSMKMTPLKYVIHQSSPEVAQALIYMGADIEEKDEDGRTPLMIICGIRKCNISLCRILLDAGAQMNSKDVRGCTALMISAEYNNAAMAALLLERGADITIKNRMGWTAREYAIKYKHPEVEKAINNYTKRTPL